MKSRVIVATLPLAVLLIGAVWCPHDPDAVDLSQRFAGFSAAHPLGTDNLGRDLLSRLLEGGWRTALVILTSCHSTPGSSDPTSRKTWLGNRVSSLSYSLPESARLSSRR
jgi:hypothetical protein